MILRKVDELDEVTKIFFAPLLRATVATKELVEPYHHKCDATKKTLYAYIFLPVVCMENFTNAADPTSLISADKYQLKNVAKLTFIRQMCMTGPISATLCQANATKYNIFCIIGLGNV